MSDRVLDGKRVSASDDDVFQEPVADGIEKLRLSGLQRFEVTLAKRSGCVGW